MELRRFFFRELSSRLLTCVGTWSRNSNHEAYTSRLRAEVKSRMEQLSREHSKAMGSMKAQHDEYVKTLRKQHIDEKEAVSGQVVTLSRATAIYYICVRGASDGAGCKAGRVEADQYPLHVSCAGETRR